MDFRPAPCLQCMYIVNQTRVTYVVRGVLTGVQLPHDHPDTAELSRPQPHRRGWLRGLDLSDITPLMAWGEGRTTGRIRNLWGELMAEFLGTMIILAFGDGCVAMAVAALPGSGRAATTTTIFLAAGDWLLIAFGWCFAVAFAVWVAGGVSGAHLNPAVTLAFAVRRNFPWRKVLPYWAAQLVGAFTGAAIVFMVYGSAINAYNFAARTPKGGGQALSSFSTVATFPAPDGHGSCVI